jgi:hypothetical protein
VYALPQIEQATTGEDLAKIFNGFKVLQASKPFIEALTAKRKALGIRKPNE